MKPILLFCQSSNNNKVVDAKFIALISHPTIVFAMLLAIPSTIHHLKGVFKICFAYLKCKQEFNFIGQKTNVNVLSYILLHQFLQHGWKTWRTHCQGSQGTEGLEKKEPKEQCNNGMRDEEGDKTTKWYEISFWKCCFETPHSIQTKWAAQHRIPTILEQYYNISWSLKYTI